MQRASAEVSTTECDEGNNPEDYSESLAPSFFFCKATHVSYAVHSLEDVLVRVLFIFSLITWPLEKEKSKQQE